MKNLVLVGFMGSGKTDAGKLAAAKLGMKFVDTDHVMEQRHNQSIALIFQMKGEAFFRQNERALIRELASQQDRVIATGGGIVSSPDARLALASQHLDDDLRTRRRMADGVVQQVGHGALEQRNLDRRLCVALHAYADPCLFRQEI